MSNATSLSAWRVFFIVGYKQIKNAGIIVMEGDVNSLSEQETLATSASTFTIQAVQS